MKVCGNKSLTNGGNTVHHLKIMHLITPTTNRLRAEKWQSCIWSNTKPADASSECGDTGTLEFIPSSKQ